MALLVGLLLALLLLVVVGGHGSGGAYDGATASPQPTASEPTGAPTGPAAAPTSPALAALVALGVAEETVVDYDRSAFGPANTDTDRNGCDTRNDVLARDLTDVRFKPGTRSCVVLSGTLVDPYTGDEVAFDRSRSEIEIDHVVPLADAWRTGASHWPYAKLLAFANDPLELLAVRGDVNAAKSDSDAAQWLPPKNACAYAARQVAVKAKYELAVTPAEREALTSVLDSCPDEVLPTGGTPTLAPNRPPPATAAPAAAEPSPAGAPQGLVGAPQQPTDPDYGTCRNAKAHGAGPYYRGRDPEYDWYRDADSDGVVCE